MNITTKELNYRFNIPNDRIATLARTLLVATIFFMPISTAATNIFMTLCLVTWLGSGQWAAQPNPLANNWVVYAVIALFAISLIGSFYSSGSPHDITFQIHKNARLLFLIPALFLLQDSLWRKRCLYAFMAAMLLTLALSMASAITPLAIVKGTAGGTMGNHFVFKDHIAQNLMMSFFALTMLVYGQVANSRKVRLFWYGVALLAIINILFFVQGRTGYISLALNALAFLLLMTNGRQRLIFIALAIVIGILTLNFSSSFNKRLQITIEELDQREQKELTSVGQRVEFIKKSITLIQERPFFGHGTGSYGKEFCRIADSAEWCEAGKAHPHNQFMAIGVQLGMFGILAYLAFIASIIWHSRLFARDGRVLAIGLTLTLVTDSMLHAPLFLVTEAQFFTLMLAVILADGPKNIMRIELKNNGLPAH